jgi:FixJ family two-component response regulator
MRQRSTTRRHHDVHGLTPGEAAVVDRLEAGETPAQVAAALGMAPKTVKVLAGRYIIGAEQLTGFDRMVRRGEARYAAALAATGKVYA